MRLECRRQLLERGRHLLLQLLSLLLQHADVGHHLPLAPRLRRGRAGEQENHPQPRAERPKPPSDSSPHTPILLCGDHEMRAPVLRPGRVVVTGIERELLAVADRAHLVGGNAQRDQVVLRRQRAPLAQREVVLGGAALVAVALDRDLPRSDTCFNTAALACSTCWPSALTSALSTSKNSGRSGESRFRSSSDREPMVSSTGIGGTGTGSETGCGGSGGGGGAPPTGRRPRVAASAGQPAASSCCTRRRRP